MEGISVFNLNSMELKDLVALAQSDGSNGSRAMNEVVRRFATKAAAIARKVCFDPNSQDDVAQIGLIAVVQAVRAHDPAKGGFISYATMTMMYAARRESQKLFDEKLASEGDGYNNAVARDSMLLPRPIDDIELGTFGVLSAVVDDLPEQQREILSMRFAEEQTPSEIAEHYGVTVSAISQRLGTAKRAVLVGYQNVA